MNMRFGMKKGMPLVERLDRLSIPEPMSGCTLWLGGASVDGYGVIGIDGVNKRAHRVAWELENGPVPDGLVLDHICRVRGCINPSHLRAVTERVNILAGTGPTAKNALKMTCPQGHPYSGSDNRGQRLCKVCISARKTTDAARARNSELQRGYRARDRAAVGSV